MSSPYNDQVEESVYEAGYDKGYEDCRSELDMKIKAVLRFYLYKDGYSASKLAEEIGAVFESKHVS